MTDPRGHPATRVYVAAMEMSIDQGITSTRAILFDHRGLLARLEHRQHYSNPGWVEHDQSRSGATWLRRAV
jgi:glycerol kinase